MSDSDVPPIHIVDDDDISELISDEPEGFDCPECGKPSKNARGLSMHLSRSHGIRKEGADAKPASLKGRRSSLEKELVNFFGSIGVMVSALALVSPKFANDGQIIMHNAENLAKAWSHAAQQNKSVDKILRSMMTVSTMGEVMMAMTMTIVPIMANHELLPGEMAFMFGAMQAAPMADD